MINPDKGYCLDEALSLLPFGRSKLYRMAKAGRVDIRRLDGKSFVMGSELLRLLQGAPSYDTTLRICDRKKGAQ